MSRVLLCLSLGALLAAGAAGAADPPDLYECTVEPCDDYGGVITCPFASAAGAPGVTAFLVTIRWNGQPLPGLWVEIELENAPGHWLCPNASLTGTTDAQGQVGFNIEMGGCSPDGPASLRIIANSVVIRIYDRVVSPDSNADGRVSLVDFVYFGNGYGNSSLPCTDYNNDGTTSLSDFTIFAACFGRECEE